MEKPNVNEGGLNLSSAKHCTVQTITWWPLSYLCKQESVELCCGTHRTKFIGCDHKTYKDNSFSWGMFYFSNQYLLLKYSWFTEMLISAVQQRYSFIHIYVCVCVCVCVLVAQLYLTLCNPVDYSPPGSSIRGTLQPRTLEWVAISFSNIYMYIYVNVYFKKNSFPLWFIIGYWI